MKMNRKIIIVTVLLLVGMQVYTGCNRDSESEDIIAQVPPMDDPQEETVHQHYDSIFDTLVCYPIGTTWEKGHFVDDFEHLFLRSRFEVVSDTLIDEKHYRRVKGEIVLLDTAIVPKKYKHETWGIFPGIERTLDPMDFYIHEERGVVTAYKINPETQRPSYMILQYDFNWPRCINDILFYSDGCIERGIRPQSDITLLDGNVYVLEDYREDDELNYMVGSDGQRYPRNALLIKTIGCVYSMFGEYCDFWLKGRLLSFRRNGVLLYEYGKVKLPERKPLEVDESLKPLLGTWDLVESYSMNTFLHSEHSPGTLEWTFVPGGVLYVKGISFSIFPDPSDWGYSVSIDENYIWISGRPYWFTLSPDGYLKVCIDGWWGSYCLFKKKQES